MNGYQALENFNDCSHWNAVEIYTWKESLNGETFWSFLSKSNPLSWEEKYWPGCAVRFSVNLPVAVDLFFTEICEDPFLNINVSGISHCNFQKFCSVIRLLQNLITYKLWHKQIFKKLHRLLLVVKSSRVQREAQKSAKIMMYTRLQWKSHTTKPNVLTKTQNSLKAGLSCNFKLLNVFDKIF